MVSTQTKRRISHEKRLARPTRANEFDYHLRYKNLNLRTHPELYRVGRSEEGVLLVEPYKSEILPHWKFKTPALAKISAQAILKMFKAYAAEEDFVGMDMARKFLQMGYTRSRRYANHRAGRKYGPDGELLPFSNDPVKAASAEIFRAAWHKAESDPVYADVKIQWRLAFG